MVTCLCRPLFLTIIFVPDCQSVPLLGVLRVLRTVLDDVGGHAAVARHLADGHPGGHLPPHGLRPLLVPHHPSRHHHDSGEMNLTALFSKS